MACLCRVSLAVAKKMRFCTFHQMHITIDKDKLRLPLRAKWVSYLLRKTVADCPGASYRVMSKVICDYVNEYTITNNILQDAREHADIFGEPEDKRNISVRTPGFVGREGT